MADLAQIRSNFVGLRTSLGPEQTPAGGLLEATNVCIRRPGMIEPRPGFDTVALPAAIASAGAKGHVEYPLDANEAGLIMDGTTTIWDGYSSFSSAVVTEDAAALTWESYKGVVARRSLFLCTGDALRAVHAPGATTAYRAGVPAPGLADPGLNAATVTSVAGPSYAANEYRAYRAVTFRKTATGQSHEARSAPSARLVNFRTTSGNSYFYILLHKTEDFLAGDVIEVYSTETSTTYPTDEMYLNQRVAITAAHITAGYVEIVDATTNDDLGMDLYTNASREGAEGAHYRPPMAGACAMFNNSLWLGDLTYPPLLQVTFPIKMFGAGSALGDPTLVNRYSYTGTFTAGSPNVTALSSTTEMKVGMLLILSHGTYRITSINTGAATLVLSANWGGSTGAAAFTAMDSIRIGSEYYPVADIVANMSGVLGSRWHQQAYTASTLYSAEWSEGNPTAGAILAQNGDYAVQRIGLTLTCILPTTSPPQVWATHGSLYSPALPEPSVATGVTMVQDVLPDHVAWSNQDEPDHFRLDNIDRVGGGGSTVMDMQASGNSILLFTDMGAYRASGYADSGISFNDLDPSVRILGRLCATSSDRFTYVLADSGVFECDENECKNLTTDTVSDLDGFIMQAAPARATTAHLVSNSKDDEVMVCLPAFYNTLPITRVYVFNTLQRAWTAWVLPLNAWVWTVKGRNRLLTATVENQEFLWVERSLAAGLPACDRDFAITISSVITSTNITISPGSGWTPAVGDVVQQSAANYTVTAITDAVRFTVHAAGLTAAAATAYEGVSCVITPSVNTLKTPHFMKVWAEGAIHWARRYGVYAYTLAFRSAITGADTATSQTRLLSTTPSTNSGNRSAPAASRFLVPRGAARGTHLCFSLAIRQALTDWALEGLTVRVRTTADKAPARLP